VRARGAQEPDFRLRKNEPVGPGLRRIAHEQIDLAARHLRGEAGEDEGDAVHEARKAFKRLRAITRVGRDQLGDEVYRQENAAFRDLGRRLSGARDAAVLVQTLDAVRDRDGATLDADAVDRLRAALAREHAEAEERIAAAAAVTDGALADLDAAKARVATWDVRRDGVRALRPGLERIYARGRKAYRVARKDPSDDNLHELRKRAKDLWHAAQIFEGHRPKRMGKLAQAAHDLSDCIGEDHDLAVLSEAAAQRAQLLDPAALQAVIVARRAKLQRKALRRAKKIYSAKPRAFVRQALR
jgi:CHAD domain-containing protein